MDIPQGGNREEPFHRTAQSRVRSRSFVSAGPPSPCPTDGSCRPAAHTKCTQWLGVRNSVFYAQSASTVILRWEWLRVGPPPTPRVGPPPHPQVGYLLSNVQSAAKAGLIHTVSTFGKMEVPFSPGPGGSGEMAFVWEFQNSQQIICRRRMRINKKQTTTKLGSQK